MKFEELTKQEQEAISELYSAMYLPVDVEMINNDLEHDYLTQNTGLDGKEYFWYMDENCCSCVEIETLQVITDSKKIEEIFGF